MDQKVPANELSAKQLTFADIEHLICACTSNKQFDKIVQAIEAKQITDPDVKKTFGFLLAKSAYLNNNVDAVIGLLGNKTFSSFFDRSCMLIILNKLLKENRIIDLLKVFQAQIDRYQSKSAADPTAKQQTIPSSHLDVVTTALVLQGDRTAFEIAVNLIEILKEKKSTLSPESLIRILYLASENNKPVFIIDHIFSNVFKPHTYDTILRNLKIIAYTQMNRNQEALKELGSICEMSLFDNDNDDETYGRVFQYTIDHLEHTIYQPGNKQLLGDLKQRLDEVKSKGRVAKVNLRDFCLRISDFRMRDRSNKYEIVIKNLISDNLHSRRDPSVPQQGGGVPAPQLPITKAALGGGVLQRPAGQPLKPAQNRSQSKEGEDKREKLGKGSLFFTDPVNEYVSEKIEKFYELQNIVKSSGKKDIESMRSTLDKVKSSESKEEMHHVIKHQITNASFLEDFLYSTKDQADLELLVEVVKKCKDLPELVGPVGQKLIIKLFLTQMVDHSMSFYLNEELAELFKENPTSAIILLRHLALKNRHEDASKVFEHYIKHHSSKHTPDNVALVIGEMVKNLRLWNNEKAIRNLEKVQQWIIKHNYPLDEKIVANSVVLCILRENYKMANSFLSKYDTSNNCLFENLKVIVWCGLNQFEKALVHAERLANNQSEHSPLFRSTVDRLVDCYDRDEKHKKHADRYENLINILEKHPKKLLNHSLIHYIS